MEYPQGSLPFLDIDITLHEGNIQTCVYRKSTNTGVLLNFNSVAPTQWKRSLITCLLNRAHVVCSNNTLFYDEIRQLKAIFVLAILTPLHFLIVLLTVSWSHLGARNSRLTLTLVQSLLLSICVWCMSVVPLTLSERDLRL